MDERIRREVERLLMEGHKIQAIKMVRETLGIGLKEAKDLVDEFHEELRKDPDVARRMADNRSGCFGVLLLVAAGLALGSAMLA